MTCYPSKRFKVGMRFCCLPLDNLYNLFTTIHILAVHVLCRFQQQHRDRRQRPRKEADEYVFKRKRGFKWHSLVSVMRDQENT